ncbi:MAG: hypothetical protein JSV86_16985 [Gemmatimonadota bacterium]|nr:MAG: hypothetical protein JSV86_16985 [Gemmatimonadota bacterium]
MSAFLCSDRVIQLIALWATRKFPGRFDYRAADKAAGALHAANCASLTDRYGMTSFDPAPRVTASDMMALKFEPACVLKQIDCYEYQTMDWSSYEGSEAARFVRAARAAAIRALPGYEEAPWGMA